MRKTLLTALITFSALIAIQPVSAQGVSSCDPSFIAGSLSATNQEIAAIANQLAVAPDGSDQAMNTKIALYLQYSRQMWAVSGCMDTSSILEPYPPSAMDNADLANVIEAQVQEESTQVNSILQMNSADPNAAALLTSDLQAILDTVMRSRAVVLASIQEQFSQNSLRNRAKHSKK
jgi:hypothetical protein